MMSKTAFWVMLSPISPLCVLCLHILEQLECCLIAYFDGSLSLISELSALPENQSCGISFSSLYSLHITQAKGGPQINISWINKCMKRKLHHPIFIYKVCLGYIYRKCDLKWFQLALKIWSQNQHVPFFNRSLSVTILSVSARIPWRQTTPRYIFMHSLIPNTCKYFLKSKKGRYVGLESNNT